MFKVKGETAKVRTGEKKNSIPRTKNPTVSTNLNFFIVYTKESITNI